MECEIEVKSFYCFLITREKKIIDFFPLLLSPIQTVLAPTTYWHSFLETQYRRSSTFLAHINNVNEITPAYIENLKALEKFVLVKYENDRAIIPNESAHFGYWDRYRRPIQLEDTEIYKEDRLGLRAMKENGQLIFLTVPNASHIEFNEEWFVDNILIYLR